MTVNATYQEKEIELKICPNCGLKEAGPNSMSDGRGILEGDTHCITCGTILETVKETHWLQAINVTIPAPIINCRNCGYTETSYYLFYGTGPIHHCPQCGNKL